MSRLRVGELNNSFSRAYKETPAEQHPDFRFNAQQEFATSLYLPALYIYVAHW